MPNSLERPLEIDDLESAVNTLFMVQPSNKRHASLLQHERREQDFGFHRIDILLLIPAI